MAKPIRAIGAGTRHCRGVASCNTVPIQAYTYKYGKLLQEMKNDILQKKNPFPKTVADMCRVLAGWKNK